MESLRDFQASSIATSLRGAFVFITFVSSVFPTLAQTSSVSTPACVELRLTTRTPQTVVILSLRDETYSAAAQKYWKSNFPGTITLAAFTYEKATDDGLGPLKVRKAGGDVAIICTDSNARLKKEVAAAR